MSPKADPSEADDPTDDQVAGLLLGGWDEHSHTRHLDPASWETLVELYGRGVSLRSLARTFNAPEEALAGELRRRGVAIRPGGQARGKRTLREDVFDTITEPSAYWLGFLMVRGYVRVVGNARIVGARLGANGVEHLEKLRAFLGSNHAITRRRASAEWKVTSARLAEALDWFGVVPGKPEAAAVIGLERDRHFWRGVVDGKGSLELVDERPTLSLRGPRGLVGQFASYARHTIPGCRVGVRPMRTSYDCSLGGAAASTMIRRLYDGCSIALDRNQVIARGVIDAAP